MSDIALTPQQLAVICALSSGVTTLAAAEQAGVHRNTIANWRRNQLPFQRALAEAQYDRALCFREKVEDLVDLAVKSLHHLLTDPNTPPSVRLKAALAILSTASTPPEPKKQIQLIVETVVETVTVPQPPVQAQVQPEPVHNPAQPAPEPPAPVTPPEVHNAAQPAAPAQPEIVHNPAQPRTRRVVARNAQCPCGSGKKYKRCCQETLAEAA